MNVKQLLVTVMMLAGANQTVKADPTEFCLVVKTGSNEMNKKIHQAFKNGIGVPACIKFVQNGNIDTIGLFEVYFREAKDQIPQSFYTDAGYDINWYTDWAMPIKYAGTKSQDIPYIKVLKSMNAVWGIRIIAEGMSQPLMFERPISDGSTIRELGNDLAFNSILFNLGHLVTSIQRKNPNFCEILKKKQ